MMLLNTDSLQIILNQFKTSCIAKFRLQNSADWLFISESAFALGRKSLLYIKGTDPEHLSLRYSCNILGLSTI